MAQEPIQVSPNPILTNFSLTHKNSQTIWRFVMPILQVPKRQGYYWEQNKADRYKLIDDTLSPNAQPNESGVRFTKIPYAVESHGVAEWIPQETLDEEDGLDILMTTTETNNDATDLREEKRSADIAVAAASYPAANKVTLTGNDQWSVDHADSQPINDIQTGMLAMLRPGNVIVFGEESWASFRSLFLMLFISSQLNLILVLGSC